MTGFVPRDDAAVMGSQGIRRRKPRPRPGSGAGAEVRENWEREHSPLTFEGQLEDLSRFGRGFASASPGMRLTAQVLVLLFIAPIVIGFLYWLFD